MTIEESVKWIEDHFSPIEESDDEKDQVLSMAIRSLEAFDLAPMGEAGDSKTIDLRVAVQIPIGMYGKLESKSGLNVKASVICPGGVIDAGFRGTIVARIWNTGKEPYHFNVGDKVCQMIVQPCSLDTWEEVDKLDEPEDGRGASGFGSTGR